MLRNFKDTWTCFARNKRVKVQHWCDTGEVDAEVVCTLEQALELRDELNSMFPPGPTAKDRF